MQMIPVSSSAIKAIGYDEKSHRMGINFTHDFTIYIFCNVPLHIFEGLLNASSKGRYYNKYIKDRYQC